MGILVFADQAQMLTRFGGKMKVLYFLGVSACFVVVAANTVTEYCEEQCKNKCTPCLELVKTCKTNQTDCGLGKPDPVFKGACDRVSGSYSLDTISLAEGDIVGVTVTQGELTFSRNGKSHGVAGRGLPGRVWAVLGVQDKHTQVSLVA